MPARRTFMNGLVTLVLLGGVCLATQAAIASPQENTDKNQPVLRAGAAAANITPPLGELVVGGWAPFPARHIHDELHARCLVLDDGETLLAFAVCDNVGIPQEVFDEAKHLIQEELEIPLSHLMMSSTHTHSATTARSSNKAIRAEQLSWYQQFLARRIADGVRRAVNNLEPARIGWGVAEERNQVFNRRWFMTPGVPDLRNPFGGIDKVRMNPPRGNSNLLRPAGPVDPEVSFLSVQATDGRPIALLANYSLHYVGGVNSGEVSADYFAIFANRIGELLKADGNYPPFVGIMSNGTSANINNNDYSGRTPSKRYEKYEKMREVAYQVADKVFEAHQQIEFRDYVTLQAAQRELVLRVRKPTEEMLQYFKKVAQRPASEEPYQKREEIYADRVKSLLDAPDEIPIILQAFRIGDFGIAAIPFEVFVEIGLELKEKSTHGQTMTLSLANGSFGYLPTPEHHELGGYETWLGTNVVEKQASVKITETLLDLLNGELAQE